MFDDVLVGCEFKIFVDAFAEFNGIVKAFVVDDDKKILNLKFKLKGDVFNEVFVVGVGGLVFVCVVDDGKLFEGVKGLVEGTAAYAAAMIFVSGVKFGDLMFFVVGNKVLVNKIFDCV